MPENETRSESDAQLCCSSCGNLIPQPDLEEGKARRIGGGLFCAACTEAKEKAEAIKCRQCGNHEVPLFDGRHYLCRKCGAVLRERRPTAAFDAGGVAAHSRVAGSRAAKPMPAFAGFLIGALMMAFLSALGLLLYTLIKPEDARSAPAPAAQDGSVDIKAIESRVHDDVMSALANTLTNYRRENDERDSELLKVVAKTINDKVQPIEKRIGKLEASLGKSPAVLKPEEDDLAAILKMAEEKTKPPAKKPPELEPVKPPIGKPAEKPVVEPVVEPVIEPVVEPVPKEDLQAAIAGLKSAAAKLADDKKYPQAIELLDSRPDIRDPRWQAERENEKQKVRKRAEELFRMDVARAEAMARGGRYEEAREVYRQVLEYGLTDMAADARKRLDELKVEPVTVTTTVKVQDDDPRVPKYLAELKDTTAAQHVRTSAAKELGVLKARSAVDDLIAAMEDRDWYLRVCAANSLEQIGDMQAVPALIRNLSHQMLPVNDAARQALVQITGKNFGKDIDKWREWWKTEGGRSLPPAVLERLQDVGKSEVIEVPKESPLFESQVVIFKPIEQTLTFVVKPNLGLKPNQKLGLLREGERLCTVQVSSVGFGHATGKVSDLIEGASIKAGDLVTIEKLEEPKQP